MGLLIIERIILESLISKEKNIEELEKDTEIERGYLLSTLFVLIRKQFIQKDNLGLYSLNKPVVYDFFKKYQLSDEFKYEVSDVFNSFLENYFSKKKCSSQSFKMKKIWLDKSDEKILNSYFINIENFIKNLEVNQAVNENRLCNKRLVFWGSSQYSSILKASLEQV